MSVGKVGKYELLEKLSEGGMGELFRARTSGPGGFERIVALKRIRPEAVRDAHFVDMFVAEAKVASLLSHQNLVHLYEFGSEGNSHYLAMEMVEGRDLAKISERCRAERTPLTKRVVVRTCRDVAMGLDHLHRLSQKGESLQLVHRDVSPQNIMLSFDGAVKLTDFGIVRWNRRERITRLGVVKGKLGYLSPEQIMDVQLDARADLFSLGIVLWEGLTGARLFPGKTDLELITQILQRPIRPPSSLNSDVSPALDAVTLRALSRERDGRFPSAQEMGHALSALGDELGTETEIAQLMRTLYPESASQRDLGLVSSVELVKVEVSEVRRFLGFPAEGAEAQKVEATKIDRPLETTSVEVATQLEALRVPKTEPQVSSAPASDDIATAPRPQVRGLPRGVGPLVMATILAGCAAFGFWLRSRQAPMAEVPVSVPDVAASAAPSDLPPSDAPVLAPIPAAPTAAETPPATPMPAVAAQPPPVRAKAVVHKKATVVGQGTLAAVQIRPWAEVVVDGQSHRWFSPGRWKLPAGKHQVTLLNPNVGLERRFDIDLAPGKTIFLSGPLESLQPQSEE